MTGVLQTAGPQPVTRPPRIPGVAALPTPARFWSVVAIICVCVVTFCALLVLQVQREQSGLAVIGDRAAPQVAAASDLYFALSDMDAQVANTLLVADATNLGFTRQQALDIYEQRRRQADRDVERVGAAAGANQDSGVSAVLDELGAYEALAARTFLLQQSTSTPPGRPSAAALASYRQTNALLTGRLLPAAEQLVRQNSVALDSTYRSQHRELVTARTWFGISGLLLVAILVAVQADYARRFRRVISPFLVAATALTCIGLVLMVSLLGQEAEHLRVAKRDAFDSILALGQARAISYDANADESRYLVDPQHASADQAAFLAKSQQIVALPGPTTSSAPQISSWDVAFAQAIAGYQKVHANVGWGGFLGTEFRNITFPGERAAAEATLLRYQAYQLDDRRLRALATSGHRAAAIAFCTSYAPGGSNYAFQQYDLGLARLIGINQNAFEGAILAGREQLAGWTAGIVAGGLLVLLLVGAGIHRRLREYQ